MNSPPNKVRADDTELDAAALARLHELDPGGKNGIVTRVLATFDRSLVATLSGLQAAEQRGDMVAMRRLTHTLKSSSASVGALELSACCATVEALARDDRPAQLPAALARLQGEGQRALGAVQRLRQQGHEWRS